MYKDVPGNFPPTFCDLSENMLNMTQYLGKSWHKRKKKRTYFIALESFCLEKRHIHVHMNSMHKLCTLSVLSAHNEVKIARRSGLSDFIMLELTK